MSGRCRGLVLGLCSHLLLLTAATLQPNVTTSVSPVSLGVNLTAVNTTTPVVFMEGQAVTKSSPLPNEYMEGQKVANTSIIPTIATNSSLPTNERPLSSSSTTIPTVEQAEVQQQSSVHARKGVNEPPGYSVNEILTTTSKPNVTSATTSTTSAPTNATTPKMIPKKPTVTVGGDVADDPSDVEPPPALPQSSTPIASSPPYDKKVTIDSSTSSKSIPPNVEYLKTDKANTPSYESNNHIITNGYFDHLPRGQPAFIIPLIISMFAVPLLALIGYQAIRRGKEAWRNRHYRRMDYLIDGMYNES